MSSPDNYERDARLMDRAIIAAIIFTLAGIAGIVGSVVLLAKPERASSFTHYSDSTWQVNDTVYWRHGADTIKLDITKLK